MRELSCEECVELSAEVSLGVAAAEDRVAVLSHVERCATCAKVLRSMTGVADGLVALVPPAVPPKGFDVRVLESMPRTPDPVPRPGPLARLRGRPLAVAAAAAAAALLAVGGWLVGENTAAPSAPVVTASFVSHGTTVGQVLVVSGADAWISMSVHVPVSRAVVRCEVREDSGALRTLGTFAIVDGYGYWAAPLPTGTAVRGATLVLSNGHALATASISMG